MSDNVRLRQACRKPFRSLWFVGVTPFLVWRFRSLLFTDQ